MFAGGFAGKPHVVQTHADIPRLRTQLSPLVPFSHPPASRIRSLLRLGLQRRGHAAEHHPPRRPRRGIHRRPVRGHEEARHLPRGRAQGQDPGRDRKVDDAGDCQQG